MQLKEKHQFCLQIRSVYLRKLKRLSEFPVKSSLKRKSNSKSEFRFAELFRPRNISSNLFWFLESLSQLKNNDYLSAINVGNSMKMSFSVFSFAINSEIEILKSFLDNSEVDRRRRRELNLIFFLLFLGKK